MPNELGRLPREVELTIFRILQESLTNIHRHSGSRTAGVRLRISKGCTFLEVKDSGKGMPQGIVGKAGTVGMTGVGLRGMRERVRQFAGKLEISSGPEGTTVTVMLPCCEAFHAAS
jgi:two-component system, NarL family, sensor kinase